jgi:hypothetical protein
MKWGWSSKELQHDITLPKLICRSQASHEVLLGASFSQMEI